MPHVKMDRTGKLVTVPAPTAAAPAAPSTPTLEMVAPDPKDQRIAELEAKVKQLQIKIAALVNAQRAAAPVEEKPAEKPPVVEEKPVAKPPVEEKSAAEKPVEAPKPAAEKPVEKPVAEKPVKPATPKPAAKKPATRIVKKTPAKATRPAPKKTGKK